VRVAIVTAFPEDPNTPRGGVEAVSVNLVQALSRHTDLELHVVTTDRSCSSPAHRIWNGIAVHRLPWVGRSTLGGAIGPARRRVSEYIRVLAPDVVHAHDTYGLMIKGLALPRVFTVHGFIYADTLVSGERWAWLRSRIWRSVERSGWADHPHIISISPYVRERLGGVAAGEIHDIDNAIAEDFFGVPRHAKAGCIFSAGAICPRKNTLALIDALAQLAASGVEAQLRLAGDIIEPRYGRLIEQRMREHGLEHRVTLLGRITTARVVEELSAASVFALASLEENAPMSIEEAMAAGVPVVTSNRCGMPYMVEDGKSGFLVDPNDPRDIAARLRRVLEDRELRVKMGARSREIARDRFHPDAVAQATRQVYIRAIDTARAGART
jgi:glycosyltransferase involved in cell wall biosynthesis